MTLGKIIERYRKQNLISMRQFAKDAGISPSYLLCLERGTHPDTGELIEPSFETIQKCAAAMKMDVFVLMNKLGIDADRDTAIENGLVAPPMLNNGKEVVPFEYISLTQEHLVEAVKERRILILPFRAPQKGDMVYVINNDYNMIIMYEIKEVDGGVYTARAEVGSIRFTLFDIDRTVFSSRKKAGEAFEKKKR